MSLDQSASAQNAPPPPGALTRLFLRNTGANLLLRVVAALAGLWATAWLIRVYGEERFGLLALALQISGLVGVLAPGVSGAYSREVAALSGRREFAALRRLAALAGAWLCGLGLLLGATLALFGFAGGAALFRISESAAAEGPRLFALAGLVLTLRWVGNVAGDGLAGLQQYPRLAVIRGGFAIVGSLATLAVARSGLALWWVLAVLAAVRLAESALLHLQLRLCLPAVDPGDAPPPDRVLLRALLRVGAPLALIHIASLLFYQTDHVVLGLLVSAEAVTAYHVAARLHNLVREFQGALGSALMPLVARESAGGNEAAVEQVLYRGTRYHLALVLPVVGTAVLYSPDFLRLWLGAPWQRWGTLAAVFVSYWSVALLTNFPGQSAIAKAMVRAPALIALTGAAVNLALSIALAPRFGVAGVIAGTLAGYAVALPLQFIFVFPRLGIVPARFLREVLLRTYPAAIVAMGLCLLLRRAWEPPSTIAMLLLQGSTCGAVFLAALSLSALSARDRRALLGRTR